MLVRAREQRNRASIDPTSQWHCARRFFLTHAATLLRYRQGHICESEGSGWHEQHLHTDCKIELAWKPKLHLPPRSWAHSSSHCFTYSATMIRALSGLLWLDAASRTAACTVFAVGKAATKEWAHSACSCLFHVCREWQHSPHPQDGSVLISHSDDGDPQNDARAFDTHCLTVSRV